MDLLSDSMTSGFDPDRPDGSTPDYISPSTIATHQAPRPDMYTTRPAYRMTDLTQQATGEGLDPSVTRPAMMGETPLHEPGLAPRPTFEQRVRNLWGD